MCLLGQSPSEGLVFDYQSQQLHSETNRQQESWNETFLAFTEESGR